MIIRFEVYGFLSGRLWEEYDKIMMGLSSELPSFLSSKLKKYLTGTEKNCELREALYIAYFNSKIMSGEKITKEIGNDFPILSSKSRFFYGLLKEGMKKEGLTLARALISFEIPDNRQKTFPEPKSDVEISLINPEDKSYFHTTIINIKIPRCFSDLLIRPSGT
mgnify:CR=1 FL=1